VRLTVGEHIVHVHLDPGFEAVHHLVQGETEVGERVGDRDGHGRCRSPGDQAVTLQGAQCLGEHLLADAGQQAQQQASSSGWHEIRKADYITPGQFGIQPAPANP